MFVLQLVMILVSSYAPRFLRCAPLAPLFPLLSLHTNEVVNASLQHTQVLYVQQSQNG